MPKSSSMSLRIDPQVKADVEAIYSQYGLSITEAINILGPTPLTCFHNKFT